MIDWGVFVRYGPVLIDGLKATLYFCSAALVIGLPLGVGLAVLRLVRHPLPRLLVQAYVEVIRSTPFLVQAFVVYYVLPEFGVRLTAGGAGVLALSAYAAAYVAEIVRGGIEAVPAGQVEAARSLGMPAALTLRRIVIPQIWGVAIPALTNHYITLIKESSLLSVITVAELTFAGQLILGRTFRPVEPYLAITVLYWLINAMLAEVSARLERRLTAYR
ncbi:MAG TPA: amino acid ABC transporter permease [Bacillota bacterium]